MVPNEFCSKSFKRLITDELLANYSAKGKGHNGKKDFSALKVYSCMHSKYFIVMYLCIILLIKSDLFQRRWMLFFQRFSR